MSSTGRIFALEVTLDARLRVVPRVVGALLRLAVAKLAGDGLGLLVGTEGQLRDARAALAARSSISIDDWAERNPADRNKPSGQ